MNIFTYDKTFEGLLCVVFEAYANRCFPDRIVPSVGTLTFVTDAVMRVRTDDAHAQRVWRGLLRKISHGAAQQLMTVFLSELPEVEMLLFGYIRKAFDGAASIELNFGDADVMQVAKIYRKVMREAEKARMFVRFQKTADGVFFAPFEPKYNVLPLVADFFADRFADQPFVIYDVKRRYGLHCRRSRVEVVEFDDISFDFNTGRLTDEQAAEDERLFRTLWKTYFKSIAIRERLNPKLHRQLMPMRFWKFLPEKQGN